MKKIISLLLSAVLILSVVLSVPIVYAGTSTPEPDVITNTFDDIEEINGKDATICAADSKVDNVEDAFDSGILRIGGWNGGEQTPRSFAIYDPSDSNTKTKKNYKPKSNTKYKLSFKYRFKDLNDSPILNVKILGRTNNIYDPISGDNFGVALVAKKATHTADKWYTMESYFTTGDKDYNALCLAFNNVASNDTTYTRTYIDDLTLVEVGESSKLDYVINDYNETKLTDTDVKNKLFASKASIKDELVRDSSHVYFDGTDQLEKTETNKVKRAVKIYDNNDPNLKTFVPKKNTVYKLTFDWYMKPAGSRCFSIAVYGNTTDTGFTDDLLTVKTVGADDTEYSGSGNTWRPKQTVYFVTGNKDYKSISLRSALTGAEANDFYSRIDDVILEEVETAVVNTYDDGIDPTLIAVSGSNAKIETDDKYLNGSNVFGKMLVDGNNGKKSAVKIYDLNESDKMFKVKKGYTYKINAMFYVRRPSGGPLKVNLYGNKGDDFNGELLANGLTLEKYDKTTANGWYGSDSKFYGYKAATFEFVANKDYDSLNLHIMVGVDKPNNFLTMRVDNVIVEEMATITNTYDDVATVNGNVAIKHKGKDEKNDGVIFNDSNVLRVGMWNGIGTNPQAFTVYDPNNNFENYEPKKETEYKLTFRYFFKNVDNTTKTLKVQLYGMTDNIYAPISGDDFGTVLTATNTSHDDGIWYDVECTFSTNNKEYTALGIAFKNITDNYNSDVRTYIDDLKLVELGSAAPPATFVTNTYDDVDSVTGNVNAKVYNAGDPVGDEKSGPFDSDVVRIGAYYPVDSASTIGFTIYDPTRNNSNYKPYNNATYKFTMRYYLRGIENKNYSINLYGMTDNDFPPKVSDGDELIGTVLTFNKNTAVADQWQTLEYYFTTTNADYTGLGLTFNYDGTGNQAGWVRTYVDELTLEKINPTQTIELVNYKGPGVNDIKELPSTSTFADLSVPTADEQKFWGFYLDNTFKTPITATDVVYGTDRVYVQWRGREDMDVITNTYDDAGVYYNYDEETLYTSRYSDSKFENNIDASLNFQKFIKGEITSQGVNDSNAAMFNEYSTSSVKDPAAVRIYDSQDSNKKLYVPRKNTIYKITFKYKITIGNYYPTALVVKGMTDGTDTLSQGTEFGTVVETVSNGVIANWREVTSYFITDDNDYVGMGIYNVQIGGESKKDKDGENRVEVLIDDVVLEEVFDTKTLFMELDGGEGMTDISFLPNEEPLNIPIPTKKDYIFDGWYTDATCKTQFAVYKMPADDMTVYAKWVPLAEEAAKFKTGFENSDYKSGIPYTNDMDSNTNSAAVSLKIGERDAYEGNYLHLVNKSGSTNATNGLAAVQLVNEDGTPYQLVKGKRYKMTYMLRSSEPVKIVLAVNNSVPSAGITPKDSEDELFNRNYDNSWFHERDVWGEMEECFEAEVTGKAYLFIYHTATSADFDNIVITPVKQNKASYVSYYSRGTLVKKVLGSVGSVIQAPNPPEIGGYDFLGWFDEDGNQFVSQIFPDHDVELKARYKLKIDLNTVTKGLKTKTVFDFDKNVKAAAAFYGSGTNSFSHNYVQTSIDTYITGDKENAHSGDSYMYFRHCGSWTTPEYTALRVFNPDSVGNMVYLEPGSVYRIKANIKVDKIKSAGLQFVALNLKPFKAEGADPFNRTQIEKENSVVTVETSPYASIVSTEFVSSISEEDLGVNMGEWTEFVADLVTGEEITSLGICLSGGYLTGAIDTITVEKLEKCTISFDSNGGSEVENKYAYEGDYIVEPDPPVKEGFEFVAWYSDKKLTKKFKFNKMPVTGDMTLYAKWILEEDDVYEKVTTYTDEEKEVKNENYDETQVELGNNDKIKDISVKVENTGNDGFSVLWIIISAIALLLVAAGVVVFIILMKKRKEVK